MDWWKLIRQSILSILIEVILWYLLKLGEPEESVPNIYRLDHYWKDGKPPDEEVTQLRLFKLDVHDSILVDLKDRLNRTRFQESFEGTNFEYGFNSEQLRKILDYWRNQYDWKKAEKEINKLRQYKTTIEGLGIHFIHVKGRKRGKSPLLLLHGWPSSFVEYIDAIPILTRNFEVVIPTIPGFGFSDPPAKKGLNHFHIARIFVKLMSRLGHGRFLVAGGGGLGIGQAMASTFPENLIGLHTTNPVVPISMKGLGRILIAEMGLSYFVYDSPKDYNKLNPIREKLSLFMEESGYIHVQATKPDTIGVSLSNHPAGLAAYILEKFVTWTDPENMKKEDGLSKSRISIDRLLTNIMLYWFSGITTSIRLYKESRMDSLPTTYVVTIPTSVMVASRELVRFPQAILSQFFHNITMYTDCKGGHFLSMENPYLLADNIKSFAAKIGVKL